MGTDFTNPVIKTTLISIAVVFMLSGCVSQHDLMVEKGFPLPYADGFDDGCHSGNKAGGSSFDEFKKDVNRFNNDKQYAQGWSDGFRQCETEQEAAQRQTRMLIEQQQLQEQKKANDINQQRALEREVMKGIDTDALKSLEKQ
ncbi:Conserved hypothetical protein [Shewanella piezotolerans WP3]|uniref:Lipoprotein n=1 Tax=Shewanella piezotolerans (strain WP3 / JCM 13877) TaxID=225849 RepID=B8CIL0_SHEPW|nr:hypothetical protein [Shewanella piezotolerans]ACJ27486.1 Conserved hypothetical protein [Shewanella piezotolerans WP3]